MARLCACRHGDAACPVECKGVTIPACRVPRTVACVRQLDACHARELGECSVVASFKHTLHVFIKQLLPERCAPSPIHAHAYRLFPTPQFCRQRAVCTVQGLCACRHCDAACPSVCKGVTTPAPHCGLCEATRCMSCTRAWGCCVSSHVCRGMCVWPAAGCWGRGGVLC